MSVIIPPLVVKRREFVLQVLRQMKLPYQWNGKGYLPLEAQKLGVAKPLYDGRDCSGALSFAYLKAGGPDIRAICNAEYIRSTMQAPSSVRSGTIFVFGNHPDPATNAPAHADHVMMYVEPGILVGAEGGGPSMLRLDDALNAGAKVWAEHVSGYMENRLLGYREFPLVD